MKIIPLFLAATVVALALPLAVSAKNTDLGEFLGRPRPAPDAKISYGKAPEQFGELFLPTGNKPHPVIVMVHGGCWLQSLPGVELMDPASAALKAHGFAVWNIDYRRVEGAGGYPATFLDVGAGVDALRGLAPKYNLDLHHVVVVGHSAGGDLALWAAARLHLPKSSVLYSANPLPITGVITLSGIDDLEAFHASGAATCGGPKVIDELVGKPSKTHMDVYADTSPARLLPIGVKQEIISGSIDTFVQAPFAAAYAAKAKAAGDDVQTEEIQGAEHFDLIDPTNDAWKKIEPLIEKLAR